LTTHGKGRVERKHGVFQDRFVKELQLKNIKTIEKANEYLDGRFLNNINNKFSIAPKDSKDCHRDVKQYGDLEQIFCWEYNRTVHNDWTIQFKNKHYQLDKKQPLLINAGKKITIHLHLDGKVSLWFKEEPISFKLLEHYIKPPAKPRPAPKVYSSAQRSKNSRENKGKTPWCGYGLKAFYAKRIATIRKENLAAVNIIR